MTTTPSTHSLPSVPRSGLLNWSHRPGWAALCSLCLFCLLSTPLALWGQAGASEVPGDWPGLVHTEKGLVPSLADLEGRRESSMAPVVERFQNDRRAVQRRYDSDGSPEQRQRLERFYRDWKKELEGMDFEALDLEARVDWLLLDGLIDLELPELQREEQQFEETSALLPFAEPIYALHAQRRERQPSKPEADARLLTQLTEEVKETKKALERGIEERKEREKAAEAAKAGRQPSKSPATGRNARRDDAKTDAKADTADARGASNSTGRSPSDTKPGNSGKSGKSANKDEKDEGPVLMPTRIVTHRAAGWVERLREVGKSWYEFNAGYDPLFTWWVKQPYTAFDKELDEYAKFLKKDVLEIDPKAEEDAPIIGDPIGREALLAHLGRALIAYTPEELIAIAERDLEWGTSEMMAAAKEMGFGDGENWQEALEKVKSLHVDPGDQPRLVRDLALEAIDFLKARDLITIPPLAEEVWRIEMMTPEQQKMNPFFLGGEVIRVSFPTDTMTNEQKQMSLRGNNIHFSRATVHHELIPGHHLQGFMTARYNSHRRAFSTPFWSEGWALYWELKLWELGFPSTPEDRIGMLFWRMHRDARVIWSLKFHLGEMSAQDCVDFLVERIGHEKENALAEVRRSLEGRYSPIYQLAYLMGGFQFRQLHHELVDSGQYSERQFHDAILQGGPMPVEMVRVRLMGTAPDRDFQANWRYAEP